MIDRAQGGNAPALYRKNNQGRINAKVDPYALQAWCWQVMATANKSLPVENYKSGSVTQGFLKRVVQLSILEAWSETDQGVAGRVRDPTSLPEPWFVFPTSRTNRVRF